MPKPTTLSSEYDETSSPAVGDIGNDSENAIVYGSESGPLFAWDNVIRNSVALEDINSDTTSEILVGALQVQP